MSCLEAENSSLRDQATNQHLSASPVTSWRAFPDIYVIIEDFATKQTTWIQVRQIDTMLEVKRLLQHSRGIHPDHVSLVHNGRRTQDHLRVCDYRIADRDIIRYVQSPRGSDPYR